MKSALMFLVLSVALTGCGAVLQSGQTSETVYSVNDGVNPQQTSKLVQKTSGQGAGSIGFPMGVGIGMNGMPMGGMGYGYGGIGMGGMIPTQGCSVNPALCRQIITTPIYSGGGMIQTTSTTTVESGNANPEIVARLEKLDRKTMNLTCAMLKDRAEKLKPADREKALASCKEFAQGGK